MARLSIFAVCLISAFVFNFAQCKESIDSNIEVQFVQSLADFLAKNPGVKLEPLTTEVKLDGPSTRTQIVHRLGNRISGDRILATDSASQQWQKPHDIRLNLNYPQSGYGSVITYLEVIVEQSSSLSNAYVVSGGIGQRQISVVVESKDTLYFKHRAAIYGY
ncbi:uncharacterized protein LOC116344252 [Contarinia nasturtii]|uniref:uncharacterized protein LOC116344252 n=1 Tax=Contarinia nasturtii TaxID=265458 RepID=UPI0012D3C422|nr:uncharacterized protein LOC116344252 [Contarinia nasturtii]